jgi:hypothetical protein
MFGSQYPEVVMELTEYKDIGEASAEVQLLAQRYYTYLEANDFEMASILLKDNWDELRQYYCGMEMLNKLEEELYNAQIYALKQNVMILTKEVPDASKYTHATPWLEPLD